MKTIVCLTTALFFVLITVANAQEPGTVKGFYIGPQLGFQKANDADKGNMMYGAAARLEVTPTFSLEGSINYRQEDFADDKVTVRNYPVMVTAMIYPIPIVYGAIGAGWYNTRFDYSDDLNKLGVNDETKQKFGYHFGGGVSLALNKTTLLTGDIRYVFIDYKFDKLIGRDVSSNFYVITAGLLFKL